MIRGFVWGFLGTTLFLLTAYVVVNVFSAKPPVRYFGRYTSFEHPADWQCWREAREIVCKPTTPSELNDAMIIGTSSPMQDSDSLDSFEAYLAAPRELEDGSTVPSTSQVLSLERREINGRTWIVGRHRDSELRGYETLYFAGIQRTVAILYTFSFDVRSGTRHKRAADIFSNSLEVF